MQLIVGLGNPGERYKNARHNTGFLVLEKIKTELAKSQFSISKQITNNNFREENRFKAEVLKLGNVMLAKPTTFMNDSGLAVSKIANFYKIALGDIYVIHDDLDLRLGEYKIQKGVGPKLHYGIASIEEKLGSKDFWRVRVGIDSRTVENRLSGEEYVLQNFNEQEEEVFEATLERLTDELFKMIFK
ncbi:MAG: Peptidyl-tRNA hydrolase [Candidatus Woesebacteria bacterium GW2011_GWA1_39_21]|uniref:Peptidyl-tRNA hydrolase n=1 Tax=Candidatus Woesebacteria bacterium GW2011_GWA1_39_21 TaxID=1618550 RepID=A0A0G0QNB3_9BACT|nr:MAG: Peptidyl-tRNA hydrolase [Candidatus Woesebacteria bacterium GW2011_GWA1_39_21]